MMKRTSVPMGVVSTREDCAWRSRGCSRGTWLLVAPARGLGAVVAVTAQQGRVPAGIVDVVHVENDALRRPHEAPAIEIDPTEPDTGQRAPVGKVLEG